MQFAQVKLEEVQEEVLSRAVDSMAMPLETHNVHTEIKNLHLKVSLNLLIH